MKITRLILVTSLLAASCTGNTGSEANSSEQSEISKVLDTISILDRTFPERDTLLSTDIPPVTPLPFGPSLNTLTDLFTKSSDFYVNLIGENIIGGIPAYTPTYQLPTVRKAKYVVVDSADESAVCYRNIPIDSLLLVNRYKYRLPDLNNYQVYYMSNDTHRNHDFTRAFERHCRDLIYQYYGHLILYDKTNYSAKVLTIFYLDYVDAVNTREFYIDKDYNIYLSDKMFSEGSDGAEEHIGPGYKVVITRTGDFQIEKLNAAKNADTSKVQGIDLRSENTTCKAEELPVSNLPFGSKLLVDYPFPRGFPVQDVLAGDTVRKPHEDELEEVGKWYNKVKMLRACLSPLIKDTVYVEITPQVRQLRVNPSYVRSSLDSFRVKLPNLHKYECYYTYERLCGNLVLYDTASRSAKVLTVYYEGAGEFSSLNRYFYITKDYTVKIFELECYESSCGMQNTYDIIILESGETQMKKRN